jgi:tetratricopeptide (TPR) repeat protein
MSRCWIAFAVAALVAIGLPARAQNTSPDRISAPTEQSQRQKDVTTLLKDGDRAMKEQSYIKAMKAYYDAVKAEPGNPDALYRLGLAYEVNGNSKAAALRFRQALKADPNHADAANALARIEGRPAPPPMPTAAPNGKSKPEPTPIATPPSATRKETLGAGAPQDSAPPSTGSQEVRELIKNGDAAFQKNNFYLAITHFLHASQLDPNNEEALYKLGLSYALSKNHQMAVFKWQKVLAINPSNEMAKRNMAIAEQNIKGGNASYHMGPGR